MVKTPKKEGDGGMVAMAAQFVIGLIEYELEQRVYLEQRDAFLLGEEAFCQQYRPTKSMVRWLCDRLRGELDR